MAWDSYIEVGNVVGTPHGAGIIRRISTTNESAHVEVNGQLYEVPLTEIDGGVPTEDDTSSNGYKDRNDIQVGDKVQRKDKSGSTGEVTSVTQRTVTVKHDSSGKKSKWFKSEFIEKFEKQDGQKEEQPEEQSEEEKKQEQRAKRTPDEKAQDTAEDLYGLFNLKDKLEQKIESEVDGELKELRDALKQKQVLEVKAGDKVNVVTGLRHKQLEQLINYASLRLSPMLVGMAGTGKTHAGMQVAEALGLSFYAISVGAQTTKTDIMGYTDASGRYVRTHFRDAYEYGGVFLMDEVDAGNANVLIAINAALSNKLAAFPDAMVDMHPDFIFIASANTFGNGTNRQYVGRNQLDAATLDRFALIEWHVDDELEENLAVGLNGKAWYMAVRSARDYVADKHIRALISPRATQKGSRLLDIGQDLDEVIDATMLASVPDDKKNDVREVAKKVFETFASEVPKALPSEVDPPTADDLLKKLS